MPMTPLPRPDSSGMVVVVAPVVVVDEVGTGSATVVVAGTFDPVVVVVAAGAPEHPAVNKAAASANPTIVRKCVSIPMNGRW